MMLSVFALSLTTRVVLGAWTMRLHERAGSSLTEIHSDAREYIRLGEQMYLNGSYGSRQRLRHRITALVRPPALPVWWWAGRSLGLEARGIVWTHVAASSIIPVLALLLARQALESDRLGWLVGMGSALSPTGIAAGSVFLADVGFTIFFSTGLILWLRIMKSNGARPLGMLGAGVMLALAHLAKPALLLFPAVVAVMALVQRRHRLSLMLLLAPMVVVTLVWSERNRRADEVFTYSAITARNLTYFVVPWVELAAESGRFPDHAEFRAVYRRKVLEHEQFIRDHPDASAGSVYLDQSRAAREVLLQSPDWTVVTLARNAFNQVSTSWASADRQFPGESRSAVWVRSVFSFLSLPGWGLLWIGLIAAGAIRWVIVIPGQWRVIVLLSLTWWYFAALCSTTFGEGSRLMYPVEAVALTLMAGLLVRRTALPDHPDASASSSA
jgi:hypothetical protein